MTEFVRMREITRPVKVALKCLIAVVLVDVSIPYWTSKVEHRPMHFRPFSATFVLRMRRNGYWWTFGVKNTAIRFADPDFLLECKISAIWRRFLLIFCILGLYVECPPYFYFRFVWPTDLQSILHASTPTSIIPTKFEVDMTIYCRVTAFLSADTSRDCDPDLWPFDFEQLKSMAGDVTNLATKFEAPTPIRSWITGYNVSRWLPLKMRTRPLRMRRLTWWPVSTGSKRITFL